MPNESFEMHGGSQDGRVFEFVAPFRPLTFSMDGHERYCLRPDNQSFGLVAPDAALVIHKDEKDVCFGKIEMPDDGSVESTGALDDDSGMASTAEYIEELRQRIESLTVSRDNLARELYLYLETRAEQAMRIRHGLRVVHRDVNGEIKRIVEEI